MAGPGVVFLDLFFFRARRPGFLAAGAVLTGLGILSAAAAGRALPQVLARSPGLFFLFLGLPFLFIASVLGRRAGTVGSAATLGTAHPLGPADPARRDRLRLFRTGALLTALAAALLVLETALNLAAPGRATLLGFWPLLPILAGLVSVIRALAPARRAESKSAAGQSKQGGFRGKG